MADMPAAGGWRIDTFPLSPYDNYCNHKRDAPNPSVRAEGPGKMQWGESPLLAG
jgi:hypothetical protein